jgi:hypothetical protein
MSERPKVLVELGAELDRVARRTLAGAPDAGSGLPGRRIWRVRPAIVLVLALALVLAAAAAAAVLLVKEGSPLPGPHAADLSPWEEPLPGSVQLAGLDAPDPGGGLVWDLRLSRSRTGEACTAVGQIYDGRLGVVGLDGVFRALPIGGVDACGVPGIAGPVLAGARVFAGRTAGEARTVVNGVAGAGARSVTVYGPGGARRLRLGPQGSFITVYQGYVEEVRPRLVVVDARGHKQRISFASSSAFEAADPDGGAPWQVSGGAAIGIPGASPDENCVQASRQTGRSSGFEPLGRALTPQICGRLAGAPLFVQMRRFDPGDGQGSGTPWGQNPARTLVYGAAAPRVASLELLGAGPVRALPIDSHGGAFLAVLDGHVDPHSLILQARLRDGREVRYSRSTMLVDGETGRRLAQPPVEPYRALAPSEPPFPALENPIASTVEETEPLADPGGGPPWALRSWRGRVDPRARFGGGAHAHAFYCWQTGVIEDGRLLAPAAGGAGVPLVVSGAQSPGAGSEVECTGIEAPSAQNLAPSMRAYAQNPSAYAPRPARTVVAGVILPPATDPVLLGAGAPRALAPDANHAYLLVLSGSYWTASLRVRVRLPGGRTLTSSPPSTGPVLRPQVRAPDPDGSAPWGYTRTSLCPAAWSVAQIGRVVDDRIAAVVPSTGQLSLGPQQSSTGSPCGSRNARLQQRSRFSEDGGLLAIETQQSEPIAGALTQAQIDRRTLPGDTVIDGSAPADVQSITLSTPADVRTVQPVGPDHVFLVVYDGIFYRGTFTATARLDDGRTVTQRILGASANPEDEHSQAPRSLSVQLRSDEATLASMRRQVSRVQRAKPRARPALLDGVPFTQLLRGLHGIQLIVAQERARIAYERTHPGVLPQQ